VVAAEAAVAVVAEAIAPNVRSVLLPTIRTALDSYEVRQLGAALDWALPFQLVSKAKQPKLRQAVALQSQSDRPPLADRTPKHMPSDDAFPASEEISPYLLYRVTGEQIECAIWRLKEGEKALALFLSEDSAEAYKKETLSSDWQVYHPSRTDLLEILNQSTSSGILLAVLDPDDTQAKELFDLREVVKSSAF
jgi:hypothetical protein